MDRIKARPRARTQKCVCGCSGCHGNACTTKPSGYYTPPGCIVHAPTPTHISPVYISHICVCVCGYGRTTKSIDSIFMVAHLSRVCATRGNCAVGRRRCAVWPGMRARLGSMRALSRFWANVVEYINDYMLSNENIHTHLPKQRAPREHVFRHAEHTDYTQLPGTVPSPAHHTIPPVKHTHTRAHAYYPHLYANSSNSRRSRRRRRCRSRSSLSHRVCGARSTEHHPLTHPPAPQPTPAADLPTNPQNALPHLTRHHRSPAAPNIVYVSARFARARVPLRMHTRPARETRAHTHICMYIYIRDDERFANLFGRPPTHTHARKRARTRACPF